MKTVAQAAGAVLLLVCFCPAYIAGVVAGFLAAGARAGFLDSTKLALWATAPAVSGNSKNGT